MDELPGNSEQARTPPPETPKTEEVKVGKVISGEVERRKKPLGQRFLKTFFNESAKGVLVYVCLEVLIPTVKDLIVEAGQEAIQRAVYGEGSSRRRTQQRRPGGLSSNYVSYDKVTSAGSSQARREDPRTMNRRNRETRSVDDILFDTRIDADEVLTAMYEYFAKYDVIPLSQLFSFAGITSRPYTDEKWGWTSLAGSGVIRDRSGKYILNLPPIEPLS